MTVPSEDILFAESAAPGDVSDPAGVRAGGYPFEAPVPYEEFNYLFRALGRWVDNLKGGSAVYASYAEFLAEAAVGDTGIINEFDPTDTTPPIGVVVTNTGDFEHVETDGEFWFVSASFAFQRRDLETFTDVLTYTPTLSVTTRKGIKSNGSFVAVAYDDKVELFNRDTGASVWTHTYAGSSVSDIAIDDDYVHLVGNSVTASYRALNIADGTTATTVAHDATLNAVTTDGRYAYAGGNAAGGGGDTAPGTKLFAVDVSLPSIPWESDPGITPPGAGCLLSNGTYLVLVSAAGGSGGARAILTRNGENIVSYAFAASSVPALSGDDLFLGGPGGIVRVSLDSFVQGESTFPTIVSNTWTGDTVFGPSVACAGQLFAHCDGSNLQIRKSPKADTVRRWRRADPATEAALPERKLAYPLE